MQNGGKILLLSKPIPVRDSGKYDNAVLAQILKE